MGLQEGVDARTRSDRAGLQTGAMLTSPLA